MNWTTITVTAGLALMLGSATDAALAASPPAHCRMTVTDLKGHAKHDKVALARLTTEQLPPVTDAYNAADPVTDFTFDEAYAAKGGKGVAEGVCGGDGFDAGRGLLEASRWGR